MAQPVGMIPPGFDVYRCSRCTIKNVTVKGHPLLCEDCTETLTSVMWAKTTMARFGLPAAEVVDEELENVYECMGTLYKGIARNRHWVAICMQLISDHQHGKVQG